MATAEIMEFATMPTTQNGVAQAPSLPATASQSVTFTTSSQSAAFNAATRFIWVRADAAANIKGGKDPTATVSDVPQLQANTDYIFGVQPGDKIAFYDGTS